MEIKVFLRTFSHPSLDRDSSFLCVVARWMDTSVFISQLESVEKLRLRVQLARCKLSHSDDFGAGPTPERHYHAFAEAIHGGSFFMMDSSCHFPLSCMNSSVVLVWLNKRFSSTMAIFSMMLLPLQRRLLRAKKWVSAHLVHSNRQTLQKMLENLGCLKNDSIIALGF